MKKAVLVTLSVTARVIVDVEDNGFELSENETQYAIEQAIDNISSDPMGYLTEDNLEKIEEDTEVPFGKGDSGRYDVFVDDIVWDTDEEDDDIELPTEETFTLTEEEYKEYCDDPDYITDLLSDKYGFCVNSCNAEG